VDRATTCSTITLVPRIRGGSRQGAGPRSITGPRRAQLVPGERMDFPVPGEADGGALRLQGDNTFNRRAGVTEIAKY